MYIQKKYGESRFDGCPFCGQQAITKNSQKIPVCLKHKNSEILDLKCLCGDWLDIREGKYGPYWQCMKCGNINFKRGLEMNPDWNKDGKASDPKEYKAEEKKVENNEGKKEYFITSDEVDCWF